MKTCSQCGEEKDIHLFGKKSASKDGHRSECKKCQKDNNKKYKDSNKEKLSIKNKEYYSKNRDGILKYYKERGCIYFQKNKKKVNEYRKNRRRSDIRYAISCRVRGRINSSLKNKSNSSIELLGCDIDSYLEYIESLFKDGMSWDNRSEWHIDHIKPICSFDMLNESEVFECFNYKNTQPLWAEDNLSKSGGL